MNKAISNLRSGLAAVVTVGLILGTASVTLGADSPSGNIIIQGTIAPVNVIVVTPVSGYNALDLSAGTKENVQVATVNEKNNDMAGYTVTLASLNAGSTAQAFLQGTVGTTNIFNYSMSYGTAGSEAAVTLVAGSAVVTTTSDMSSEAGAAKSLLVTYVGSSWKHADTYSDTITLTIAGK
jgi:hypothetical protein